MDDTRRLLPSKWVFKLDPYDRKAKNTIAYLRKSLSPNYRLKVRGRGTRAQPGDDRGVPLSRAQRVVVYVFHKDGTGRQQDIAGPQLLPASKPRKVTEPKEKLPAGGSLNELIGKLKKSDKEEVAK